MTDYGNWRETQIFLEEEKEKLAGLERQHAPKLFLRSGGGLDGVRMRGLRRTIAQMEREQSESTHRDEIGGHTGACLDCALVETRNGISRRRSPAETADFLRTLRSQGKK